MKTEHDQISRQLKSNYTFSKLNFIDTVIFLTFCHEFYGRELRIKGKSGVIGHVVQTFRCKRFRLNLK